MRRMANNFQFSSAHSAQTPFSLSSLFVLLSRQKRCVIFLKFSLQMENPDGNFHPLTFLSRFWSYSPKNHQHLTTMQRRRQRVCWSCRCHRRCELLFKLSSQNGGETNHLNVPSLWCGFSLRFDKIFGVRFATTKNIRTFLLLLATWARRSIGTFCSIFFCHSTKTMRKQDRKMLAKIKGISTTNGTFTQFTIAIKDVKVTERGA